MTLQTAVIKPNEWAPICAGAVRGFVRAIARAAADRRRRRQTRQAFRQWMRSERALDDMGCADSEAEWSRRAFAGSVPLGYLGFASLLFQNRSELFDSRAGGDRP
jgi:hypothetical protein